MYVHETGAATCPFKRMYGRAQSGFKGFSDSDCPVKSAPMWDSL